MCMLARYQGLLRLQWNGPSICVICYTCVFPAVTSPNDCCEKGPLIKAALQEPKNKDKQKKENKVQLSLSSGCWPGDQGAWRKWVPSAGTPSSTVRLSPSVCCTCVCGRFDHQEEKWGDPMSVGRWGFCCAPQLHLQIWRQVQQVCTTLLQDSGWFKTIQLPCNLWLA